MSAFDKLFGEDRVWNSIQANLRMRRTRSSNKFNCPMCVSRGYTPDTRKRGGLGYSNGIIGISCFNCNFETGFRVGGFLGKKMKDFLSAIGVSSIEISRLNYWAATLHHMAESKSEVFNDITLPSFQNKNLPEGAKSIQDWVNSNCQDPDFFSSLEYIYGRGIDIAESFTYYWTPSKKNNLNKRIIIPCYYDERLVGWVGRSFDSNIVPKYYNETPKDFLFNSKVLYNENRNTVIAVEGIFDAISINGLGLLGAKINEKQAAWINSCDKRIIVVPDRDKAGARLIDYALKYGWEISFPRPMSLGADRGWWSNDIKDTAQAVETYGVLYTLRSIIKSATDNKMKINLMRKSFPSIL